jgi:hypothetical protein
MSLFDGVGHHLRRIADLAAGSRFDEAIAAAERSATAVPEATAWRLRLQELSESLREARDDAGRLAELAERWSLGSQQRGLPASLASAIVSGLYGAAAAALEQTAPGAVHEGRPAGWYWLKANRPDEAEKSLEATVALHNCRGVALVLLGNIAHDAREAAKARLHYRRAYITDPFKVPTDDIKDDAVKALLDDAQELQLRPPEPWVPLVGFARGVLPLVREMSIHAEAARFQALLDRRSAVEARKEMKALAPELFKLLMENGQL